MQPQLCAQFDISYLEEQTQRQRSSIEDHAARRTGRQRKLHHQRIVHLFDEPAIPALANDGGARVGRQHHSRCHAAECDMHVGHDILAGLEGDVQRHVDDGNVVVATLRLLVRMEVLVARCARNRQPDEQLVRFDDVAPVAGEEPVAHVNAS